MALIGIAGLIAATLVLGVALMGIAQLLWVFPSLFFGGIICLALDDISRRLFTLERVTIGTPDPQKCAEAGFVKLTDVEGRAMCLGCRQIGPKAGMYYNQAQDIYYHPRCLPQSLRTGPSAGNT